MEMDCIRTQATVSALHDGESVTEENAEAARSHVAECDTCRAFESDLGALGALAAPTAPPELVDHIMVAVAALAAERLEEQQQAVLPDEPPIATEPEPSAPRFEWFTRMPRWGAFGTLAAGAAALVLVIVIATRPGTTPQTASVESTAAGSAGIDLTFSNKRAPDQAPAAPVTTPAPARAPDYLVFNSRVFAPGALLADSVVATQSLGTVTTAFGGAGSPASVPAYRSPLTDGSIVVTGPDGARVYNPVIRMFSSVKYQLVAGNTVERFGLWPELPGRFPAPTSPDGSPTFTLAGGDALGMQTFTAQGIPQAQGFAVAPGTPSGDPAGSNPNWTWWEPLQIP